MPGNAWKEGHSSEGSEAKDSRLLSEHEFIKRLVEDLSAGYGLVPFIGSGCSSHSGILMGEQFSEYLAWTVFLCVAPRTARGETEVGEREDYRWNLRVLGWPPYPTNERVERARDWFFAQYVALAKRCKLIVNEDETLPEASRRARRGVGTGRLRARRRKTTRRPRSEHLTSRVWFSGWEQGVYVSQAEQLYAPVVPPFLRDPVAPAENLTPGLQQHHAHFDERAVIQGGLLEQNISPTSEDAIRERAVRSLYDWRATLHFLSELQLSEDQRTLLLVDADPTVIDDFNVHITQGRRPNLVHTMLANLRQMGRMRTILTTNFDTLIEDAFAEQHRRIEVAQVSAKGALPAPNIVHARDTVVKLHGSMNETRADFSLDTPPTPEDCRRFFHYVRGGWPGDKVAGFVPGMLLVAGYSGSDARCVRLIKFVLDGDRDARLYWICHNKSGHEQLRRLFSETAYAGRVIATISPRVDLLLYELYQQQALCLPPAGGSYVINQHVPPGISFRGDRVEDEGSANQIVLAATWLRRKEGVKLLVVDGESGVLQALRGAMDEFASKHRLQTLWLELDDYADTASLAHEMLQLIAMRRGVFQLNHAQLCPAELCDESHREPADTADVHERVKDFFDGRKEDWENHLLDLKRHIGIDPRQWVVTVYGRNGPGGCCGWEENKFWELQQYGDRASGMPGYLPAFLGALTSVGFTVLYAPYTKTRQLADQRRKDELAEALKEEIARWVDASSAGAVDPAPILKEHFKRPDVCHGFAECQEWLGDAVKEIQLSAPPFDADTGENSYFKSMTTLLREVSEAFQRNPEGRDFVAHFAFSYGASLFRQSRHYSAMLNEGVLRCPYKFNVEGRDNDLVRHQRLETLLTILGPQPQFAYRKPGGFAWIYRNVALGLRCLTEALSASAAHAEHKILPSAHLRADDHLWIGDWYCHAYRVSGHAGPLMEAAYHFCQCILHAREGRRPALQEPDDLTLAEQDRIGDLYRLSRWRLGVRRLLRTVRQGHASLRFWFGRNQLLRWFDAPVVEKLAKDIEDAFPIHERHRSALDQKLLKLVRTELEYICSRVDGHPPKGYDSLVCALPDQPVEGPTPSVVSSFAELGSDEANADSKPREVPYSWRQVRLDDDSAKWWEASAPPERIKLLLTTTQDAVIQDQDLVQRKKVHRKIACHVLEYFPWDQRKGAAWVQELVEWTFVIASRAKREEHAARISFVEPTDAEGKEQQPPHAAAPIDVRFRHLLTDPQIRKQWVRTCVFAQLSVDAWEQLPPGLEQFGAVHASKALAMYGLALARLDRFFEAHRRFNQSEAILKGAPPTERLVGLAILDLRRAEAYLVEAHLAREVRLALPADSGAFHLFVAAMEGLEKRWAAGGSVRPGPLGQDERTMRQIHPFSVLSEQRLLALREWLTRGVGEVRLDSRESLAKGLDRVGSARADDAWACLERTEQLLGGRTHSSLWWSRMRATQLHAFAVDLVPRAADGGTAYLRLRQRAKKELSSTLRELWLDGRLAAPDDAYNRLRLLDYYVRAMAANGCKSNGAVVEATVEWNTLEMELKPKASDVETLSQRHLANVRTRITTWEAMDLRPPALGFEGPASSIRPRKAPSTRPSPG